MYKARRAGRWSCLTHITVLVDRVVKERRKSGRRVRLGHQRIAQPNRPTARSCDCVLPSAIPSDSRERRMVGPGFSEWTNTAKARPLFPGHYQPHVPADSGFYDLRVPETRVAQASMAREYGVEAFCYWHYWFAGRRILERPYRRRCCGRGEPDFPFCLGWANQTWSGIWHGAADEILIEQTYPGPKTIIAPLRAPCSGVPRSTLCPCRR